MTYNVFSGTLNLAQPTDSTITKTHGSERTCEMMTTIDVHEKCSNNVHLY